MQADKKDLEILVITHKYPPSVGGMQKQSYELIKNLERYAIVHKIIFNGKYPKVLFLFIAPFWALIKLSKHPGIGIVHANDGLMALFITPLLWFSSKKLAVTIHGLDIVFAFSPYQYWAKHFLPQFSIVIAVSEETKAECVKRGIPPDKVHFIQNGFEPSNGFVPSNQILLELQATLQIDFTGKVVLCSVGRPIERKGFVWFIENVLEHISHPFIYVIAGPRERHLKLLKVLSRFVPQRIFLKISHMFGLGMEALQLNELMTIDKYKGKVVFTGHLPQAQLDNLVFHSDLFVMPNLKIEGDYEGFGLVALEAASIGTLCLAANTDGIPSAIQNGVNGILLPSSDAKAWSEKINELLGNPVLRLSLADSFQKGLVQNSFTWQKMAERYYDLFRAKQTTTEQHP